MFIQTGWSEQLITDCSCLMTNSSQTNTHVIFETTIENESRKPNL